VFVEAEDVECGVRTGVPSLSDTPPLLCFAGLACAFVCTPDGPLQSPRWWLKGKPYQRLEPLRDNPKGTGTGGLVPETACEEFNRFLDRAMLVGSHKASNIGYF
jgi:hypothetical protein